MGVRAVDEGDQLTFSSGVVARSLAMRPLARRNSALAWLTMSSMLLSFRNEGQMPSTSLTLTLLDRPESLHKTVLLFVDAVNTQPEKLFQIGGDALLGTVVVRKCVEEFKARHREHHPN